MDNVISNLGVENLVSKDYVDLVASNKSEKGHKHDDLVTRDEFDTHNHNNKYYTKDQTLTKEQVSLEIERALADSNFADNTDILGRLAKKADKEHRHTELEVRIAETENSITNLEAHTHDNRYYTENEIDSKIERIDISLGEKVDTVLFEQQLSKKSDKDHTHTEFENIEENISEIQASLEQHQHIDYANKKDVYTKAEVEGLLDETDELISELEVELSKKVDKSDLDSKADSEHLHDDVYSPLDHKHDNMYYTKSNTYTKAEVDANITDAINQAILEGKENEVDLSIYATKAEMDNKADVDHIHDEYSPISHKHDNLYYAKNEVYTKSEVDEKDTLLSDSIKSVETDLKNSISTINKSIDGKAEYDHTHDDLYSPLGHKHDFLYYTKA